jgi:3-methyladenine DNA glycosylase AlkD
VTTASKTRDPAKPRRAGARVLEESPAARRRAAASRLREALAWLKSHGTRSTREGMARYGITAEKAFGVPVGRIQVLAKRLGRSHDLAAALWKTGWYEARLLASFVDEPALVTPEQLDRWCRDFDSWAVVDTACFHLFDRTPHAFRKVAEWARRSPEFEKRAGFALLACVALHDRTSQDAPFVRCLPLIERGASDERNFVKKGVSWALRGIGRRSPALHLASVSLAWRLSSSPQAAARWVGKDALRELTSPGVIRALEARRALSERNA